MATKRPGKKDQSNGASTEEQAHKQARDRQEQKQQILSDQKKHSSTIRWIITAILLVVAAISLYYYFSSHVSAVSTPFQSSRDTGQGTKSQFKSTKKTSSQTGKKKTLKKSTKESKFKRPEESKTKRAAKKPFEKKPRILQKPFSPSDPDKPYLVEILHGDNLLAAGKHTEALQAFNDVLKKFPQSPRGLYGKAVTLSKMSEEKKSNKLMDTAIDFYKKVALEGFIGETDVRVAALVELADRAYERGKATVSIKALERLVSLKEDNKLFSNRLGLGYISDGKLKKAKAHFKSHLEKFPDDHFANAQLGYILYNEKRYEQALPLLLDGIRNDEGVKVNPKFYRYAGESLTKLNRSDESYILYSEAVKLKLFPSVWQRPLFSEPNLRASSWWNVQDTGYMQDIQRVEKALSAIKDEARSVFDDKVFSFSPNGISHSPHFVLFLNGKKNSRNCQKAPKTCTLIDSFPEAAHCRRGSVKFSFIPPKAHISAFVGLTNTKLQIIATLDTEPDQPVILRVAEEKRDMGAGQLVVLDESFEQEIWNTGSKPALFLLIDVWHPDLSTQQLRQLGPL